MNKCPMEIKCLPNHPTCPSCIGYKAGFAAGLACDQPCEDFREEYEQYNAHECPKCLGTRRFCINCNFDHHDGGWRLCNFNRWRSYAERLVEVIDDLLHHGTDIGGQPYDADPDKAIAIMSEVKKALEASK